MAKKTTKRSKTTPKGKAAPANPAIARRRKKPHAQPQARPRGNKKVWHIVDYHQLFEPPEAQRKGRSTPLPFAKLITAADSSPEGLLHTRKLQSLKGLKDGLVFTAIYYEVVKYSTAQSVAMRGYLINWAYEPPAWSDLALSLGVPDLKMLKRAFAAMERNQLIELVEPPHFARAMVLDCPPEQVDKYEKGRRMALDNVGEKHNRDEVTNGFEKSSSETEKKTRSDDDDLNAVENQKKTNAEKKSSGKSQKPAENAKKQTALSGERPPQGGLRPPQDGQRPENSGGAGGDVNSNINLNNEPERRASSAPGNGKPEQEQKTADGLPPNCNTDANPNAPPAHPTATETETAKHADADADVPTEADPLQAPSSQPLTTGPAPPPGENYPAILGIPEQVAARIFVVLYPGQSAAAAARQKGEPPDEFTAREIGCFEAAWKGAVALGLGGGELNTLYDKAIKEAGKTQRKRTAIKKSKGAVWRNWFNKHMAALVGQSRWKNASKLGV